jgi:hypothetical protein
MRLWRRQRAEQAEDSPEFARRQDRAARQRAAAAETRKLWKALGGA